MGFLDKVKSAVGAPNLQAAVDQYAPEVSEKIIDALGPFLQQASGMLRDDDKYLAMVATPLFRMLPLPVQLLGRERIKWDPIMLDVRNEAVHADGGHLSIAPGAPQIVLAIVQRHFAG